MSKKKAPSYFSCQNSILKDIHWVSELLTVFGHKIPIHYICVCVLPF